MISGPIIKVGGKIPGYICLGCGLLRRTQCMCTSWGDGDSIAHVMYWGGGGDIPDLIEFSQPPLYMFAKIVRYSNKIALQSPSTPLATSLGP